MPRHHALAFLFDMDGTLIDSHVLVDRTWSAWCARRGFDLEEIRPYTHGVRTEDTLRMVAPHLDVATEVAWMEEIETDTSGGIKLVPNAGHFLARVPDEHWAVVTSASRPVLDARFEACGWYCRAQWSPPRPSAAANRRRNLSASRRKTRHPPARLHRV